MSKRTAILAGLRRRLFAGVGVAGAVDFDGVNDNLSRTSDLVGNVDGKTFTFSVWFYIIDGTVQNTFYESHNAADFSYFYGLQVKLNSNGQFAFECFSSGNTGVLNGSFYDEANSSTKYEDGFYHLLASVDMADQAGSLAYLNDMPLSAAWATFTDASIGFQRDEHRVADENDGQNTLTGRLAHLYLDHTWRDLSIEANRRLFITEDGKPSDGLAALAPILYLPLTDPATAHINEGTGGDLVQNGIFARSGRGPNQYNAVVSDLDGGADFLSRTSLAGVADGKEFTLSFTVKRNVDTTCGVIGIAESGSVRLSAILQSSGSSNQIVIRAYRSDTTKILDISVDEVVINDAYGTFTISIDMTTSGSTQVLLDGVAQTVSINTFTDDAIDLTCDGFSVGSGVSGAQKLSGILSEIWFDDSYTEDLSGFYDTSTNKPKYLGEDGELPTDSAPLIYLPMRADDAGRNLGTGGDFEVNSGPFAGARGPSEYWANSIVVDGANYLSKAGGIFCQSLVKWLSTDGGSTWNVTYANAVTVTDIGSGTDNGQVAYYFGTSEDITWAEVEHLKFTDAFGYPVKPKIGGNTVLFLDFSDISNPGKNLGTDGDYVVTGTIPRSGDVKG